MTKMLSNINKEFYCYFAIGQNSSTDTISISGNGPPYGGQEMNDLMRTVNPL